MEDAEKIVLRRDIWKLAEELVKPIITEHGVEKYSIGTPFSSTSIMTKVDQHIDQIIRVAEWLMEDE